MNLETTIQNDIEVYLSENGFIIFRNNVGGWKDEHGRLIRYGLFKGSSDLIGLKPIIITEEYLGKKIAQFCAIETKTNLGSLSPAQKRFLNMVRYNGGICGVARENSDIEKLFNLRH